MDSNNNAAVPASTIPDLGTIGFTDVPRASQSAPWVLAGTAKVVSFKVIGVNATSNGAAVAFVFDDPAGTGEQARGTMFVDGATVDDVKATLPIGVVATCTGGAELSSRDEKYRDRTGKLICESRWLLEPTTGKITADTAVMSVIKQRNAARSRKAAAARAALGIPDPVVLDLSVES